MTINYFIYIVLFLWGMGIANAEIVDQFNERICNGNQCSVIQQFAPEFWMNGSDWQRIDMNLINQGCSFGYTWCNGILFNQEFKNQFTLSSSLVNFTFGNYSLKLGLNSFGTFVFNSPAVSINGEIANYSDIISGVDLIYRKAFWGTKAEIIIDSNATIAPILFDVPFCFAIKTVDTVKTQKGAIRISNKANDTLFMLPNPTIEDRHSFEYVFNYTVISLFGGNYLACTTFPIALMKSLDYPIVIDPTTTTVNQTASEDLEYSLDDILVAYTCTDNVNSFRVGRAKPSAPTNSQLRRSILNCSFSLIPSGATITEINLTVTPVGVGTLLNSYINITQIHNTTNYVPCSGGGDSIVGGWNDAGNGTQYLFRNFTSDEIGTRVYLNLTNATADANSRLGIFPDIGFGFYSQLGEGSSGVQDPVNIRSIEFSTANLRPDCTITYQLDEEDEEDFYMRRPTSGRFIGTQQYDNQPANLFRLFLSFLGDIF